MFWYQMKMISPLRIKRKNSRGRNQALFVGAVVTLITAAILMTGLFSRTFYGAMVALTGASTRTVPAASSFIALFSSKAGVAKENAQLKAMLAEKKAELADRDLLERENADLRASQQYAADTGGVIATVLSKPPFTPFDIFVLDANASQGVVTGNRAMIGQTYIGTVSDVTEGSSRMTLLSSSGSTHEAFVGDEALPVLLKGKGGGNFETSLPLGTAVAEGDIVFTYYGTVPYQVGRVAKIIADEDNTLMTILLSIPFNLYSINHVEIIP